MSGTITVKDGEWEDVYFNPEYQDEGMHNVKDEEITVGDPFVMEDDGVGFVVLNKWQESDEDTVMEQVGLDSFTAGQVSLIYCKKEAISEFNALLDNLDATAEEKQECYKRALNDGFPVFGLYTRNAEDDRGLFSDGEFGTRFTYAEKIGTFSGKEYYFAYNDTLPAEGFSDEELRDIQALIDSLDEIKDNLILFPEHAYDAEAEQKKRQDLATGLDMAQFETTDLEGNTVTQDVFKDYDITMVNVWATWCGPCRSELPDLEKAYENLPENANIISICEDANEEEELAKAVVEKTGMTYTVLMLDEELEESVMQYISAFPTTFLVDSEGHLVGTPLIGVPSDTDDIAQYYLDYINNALSAE